MNNFLVGIAPGIINITSSGNAGNGDTTEELPTLGLTVGYRTHFLKKLGVKVEYQVFAGTPTITVPDDRSFGTGVIYGTRDVAYDGNLFVMNAVAQMEIGPLGRFVIEPGVGYSWMNHSKTKAGNGALAPIKVADSHQAFYNGTLGAGLYIGNRDQFTLSAALMVGTPTLRSWPRAFARCLAG